jgi:hypothetical protein
MRLLLILVVLNERWVSTTRRLTKLARFDLAGALDLLEQDLALADALGAAGRTTLEAEHALPAVLDRYERALLSLASGRTAA